MRYLRVLICGLAVLAALIFSARSASAQDDPDFETGIKPYGTYDGGNIDTINMNNGNLSFQIPLISYPQVGGKLKLNLVFDTSVGGYFYNVGYIYDPYGNIIGNTTTETFLGDSGSVMQTGVPEISSSWTDDGNEYLAAASVSMSDGPVHQLGPTSLNGPWRSTDATGWVISGWDYPGFTGAPVDSDGISYYTNYGTGFAKEVDSNGNTISLGGGGLILTDTLGRVINMNGASTSVSNCPANEPSQPTSASVWTPPGVNGGTYQITFCSGGSVPYSYYYWDTDGGQGTGGQEQESYNVPEYLSIVLPNGTFWTIQYSNDGYYNPVQITFPTGGSLCYPQTSWKNMIQGDLTSQYYQVSHLVQERQLDVNAGATEACSSSAPTWTYSYYGGGGDVTTAIDPEGNETVHTFSFPARVEELYETETQYYQGTSSLLKTVNTTYASTSCGGGSTPIGAVPTQITTTWPNGQASKIEYGYDSGFTSGDIWEDDIPPPYSPQFSGGGGCLYGKQVSKQEYDYGGSSPFRTTTTSYQFQNNLQGDPQNYLNANLLNLPYTIEVSGSGPGSSTIYGYDETGCTSRACGNQTSVRHWLNTTNNYLVTTNTYDQYGRLTSSLDPKSNSTTYSYSSATCSGGSVGYAGTGPTSVTNALGQITSYTYDCNTGLEDSVTDPNGVTKITSYDTTHSMPRVSEISYENNPPDTGATTFCYTDEQTCAYSGPTPGASVVITQALTSGTNKISMVSVDGLGRESQTMIVDPQGNDYTLTQYDALGRKYRVYNPTRCSPVTTNCGESTWGYTTYIYDALGRTTSVTKQDGGVVQTTYTGNSTTVTDEAGNQRRSYTDAAARLEEVDEPGGVGGSPAGGSGSGTITGTEQSVGGSGTAGTGTVTISGAEESEWYDPCQVYLDDDDEQDWETCEMEYPNGEDIYDSGEVYVTVNGVQTYYLYDEGDTPTSVATGLANAVNHDGSMPVSATASGDVVTLTAKTTGASTNYSFSSTTYWDSGDFSSPSFTGTTSGSTLTGGSNPGPATYDSGTVWITVDGFEASVSYGEGSTSSSVATAIASALNGSGSPVTASSSGSTVTLTSKDIGSDTDYSLSQGSSTNDPGTFSHPSFGVSLSGSALAGGSNGGNYSLSSPTVTTYTYDALDDLIGVTQGGSHSRSYVYDSMKRLLQSNNAPDAGTVCYGSVSGSACQDNGYDADGNLIEKTDGRGIVTCYGTWTGTSCNGSTGYDAINELLMKSYSNGDTSVTYTYGESSCLGGPSCYNVGRRTSMTDAGGTEHFSYDPLGREWVEQRTTNGYTYKTSYSYNLDGSMASMTYPSGRTINYTLDSAGRPSIAQDQNGTTYASGDCSNGTTGNGTCYAPTGGVSQVQYGSNLVSTLIYNSRLQPCWLYATTNSSILSANSGCSASDPGPGNILDLSYIFNLGSSDNGNVMGITNNANNSRSQLFAYDTLNRIIMAGTPETSGTNCWGETYSYDAWANLTAIGAQAGYSGCTQESGMSIAIASGTNQVSSFSYDASGNTLNDTVNTYTWNAESEMSSSDSSVNYIYDGDGDRLEKSDGKMYWYGAGAEILDESNLSGSFTNEYVFFGGKRIAMLSGGNVYYYAEDFLGSTSKMVQSGQMSACFDADYYPFGGQRIYTNSCTPVYQFEGKERDTETGNDDFGARYYSWRFGRWESADWSSVPVAVPYATLANPQTLNLYAMVADNPETDADLDGHYWDICHNAYDCSGVVSTSAGSESDPEDANNEASNPQQMSTNQEQQKEQQQAQQQQATANSVVNKLSVGQIAAIVYNETASLSNSGSQNDSIDAARTDVATSIINADVEYGDNRGKVAGTAPDTVSKAVIKTSAYKSSLGAAEAAYVAWKAGKDPTGGATHFNLRGNDSTANFQRSRTNSGFAIKTHSGPFNNSFPTPGLPKTGVYVNTYE